MSVWFIAFLINGIISCSYTLAVESTAFGTIPAGRGCLVPRSADQPPEAPSSKTRPRPGTGGAGFPRRHVSLRLAIASGMSMSTSTAGAPRCPRDGADVLGAQCLPRGAFVTPGPLQCQHYSPAGLHICTSMAAAFVPRLSMWPSARSCLNECAVASHSRGLHALSGLRCCSLVVSEVLVVDWISETVLLGAGNCHWYGGASRSSSRTG